MENGTHDEKEPQKQAETAVENAPADATTADTRKADDAGAIELKKVQDDLAEARDKYLRLYAEFENHRRRTAKERIELTQTANEQLIIALLPIADDFERATKAFGEKGDKETQGFLLIHNKLKKVLEQYGAKAMDTRAGSEFDPDLHEAITQIPGDGSLKGKVVEIVEKGYLLNEKVIRFAKVVVGS
jgi:molecular chaperone GrpE